MRGGAIFTTELLLWYCAMLLWREMDSLQLLTLYLTLTPIVSVRKAKINLHTTPKLTVVMPISCLLPCADPGIFVRRGGGVGGSTAIWQKKLWQRCLFVGFFLLFFLVLSLFYRSQMVNLIFQGSGGGTSFSREGGGGGGGGGLSDFFQGGPLLIPYRNPYSLWFSRGVSGPPVPPLDPHLAAILSSI